MNNIMNILISEQLNFNWITPALALAAGIITSLSPCCLSMTSVLITLISGYQEPSASRCFKFSLLFAVGASITFTALGIISAGAGKFLYVPTNIVYLLLGIILVLLSLQTWNLFTFIPSSKLLDRPLQDGYKGALICGLFSGFFSAPCCTPILAAIIVLIATTGNFLWGICIMLAYAFGHNLISIAAGTSFVFSQTLIHSSVFKKISKILNFLLGLFLLFFAFYMFYMGF